MLLLYIEYIYLCLRLYASVSALSWRQFNETHLLYYPHQKSATNCRRVICSLFAPGLMVLLQAAAAAAGAH